ncbi:MAG: glycosyltransferase family 4 protein [Lachnospiraceae bacterium]|nr:glycosyltransferase family 4 protein [Lachnospiraceae bacterium]
MKKIVLIIDCPQASSSKKWVYRELALTGLPIDVVDCKHVISHIEQRGAWGKLIARWITFCQCIKAMKHSKKGDVVFCWSQWSGLLFNMLPGAKTRKIISYNWLTPVPNSKTRFLYANALQNKNLVIVINLEENRDIIAKSYQVEKSSRMLYIPDVFDDSEQFEKPFHIKDNRYCFSGGRANRDWKLFCRLAELNTQIRFEAVANRADWDDELPVPSNVSLHFDIPAEEYYALLRGAYLAIYPLKENKVSGLVNIVKASQMGKIVLTTRLPVTQMYYPISHKEYLLEVGKVDDWCREIQKVYAYTEEEYNVYVQAVQQHIQRNFSPEMAGQILREQIRKWEKGE